MNLRNMTKSELIELIECTKHHLNKHDFSDVKMNFGGTEIPLSDNNIDIKVHILIHKINKNLSLINEYHLLLHKIVKERNERLNKSKETGDYEFCVAHGLTEAIRCFPDLGDESNV